MKEEYLELVIKNRERALFEGRVKSVSSFNEKGRFDVLPQHANFISLIEKEIIYVDIAGRSNSMTIRNGIIQVHNNIVNIFLGISG